MVHGMDSLSAKWRDDPVRAALEKKKNREAAADRLARELVDCSRGAYLRFIGDHVSQPLVVDEPDENVRVHRRARDARVHLLRDAHARRVSERAGGEVTRAPTRVSERTGSEPR